jgi:hypothetical protein
MAATLWPPSGFARKVSDLLISLCNLCVLCVFVVSFWPQINYHGDTEDTEVAQRNQ